MNHQSAGATLIEVILYIALIGTVITSIVAFSWNMIYSQAKSATKQELVGTLRFASDRIAYEMRNASVIQSLSATSVTLNSPDAARNPTVIDLQGGRIRVGWASDTQCPALSPCPITPARVTITNLQFTNLSRLDSNNIQTLIAGAITGDRSEYQADQTVTFSAEIRSH